MSGVTGVSSVWDLQGSMVAHIWIMNIFLQMPLINCFFIVPKIEPTACYLIAILIFNVLPCFKALILVCLSCCNDFIF